MHNDQNQVIEAGSQIYQHDANFNTTAVIDTTGAVQERYLYDPYGSPTYKTSTWGTRSASSYDWLYMHQGGRYDAVGNLYHFRNRDHSPTLGRWMQNDPLGYVDGMNRYEYEMGGPEDGLDPEGLRREPNGFFGISRGDFDALAVQAQMGPPPKRGPDPIADELRKIAAAIQNAIKGVMETINDFAIANQKYGGPNPGNLVNDMTKGPGYKGFLGKVGANGGGD